MKLRGSLLVFLVVALAALAARADEDHARKVYADGQAAFEAGNYEAAIKRFEEAYAESNRTAILWNIAQSYRRQYEVTSDVRYLRRARLVYDTYSQLAPSAADRAEGKRAFDEVSAILAHREGTTATPPTPPVATGPAPAPPASPPRVAPPELPPDGHWITDAKTPPREPLYKKWWLWTGIAAVVVVGAIGAGVALASSGSPALPSGNGGSYTVSW